MFDSVQTLILQFQLLYFIALVPIAFGLIVLTLLVVVSCSKTFKTSETVCMLIAGLENIKKI